MELKYSDATVYKVCQLKLGVANLGVGSLTKVQLYRENEGTFAAPRLPGGTLIEPLISIRCNREKRQSSFVRAVKLELIRVKCRGKVLVSLL